MAVLETVRVERGQCKAGTQVWLAGRSDTIAQSFFYKGLHTRPTKELMDVPISNRGARMASQGSGLESVQNFCQQDTVLSNPNVTSNIEQPIFQRRLTSSSWISGQLLQTFLAIAIILIAANNFRKPS